MLTTNDNPYDPFVDFDQWFMYDTDHKYNSSGVMMRIAHIEPDMTEEEENIEIERAIDQIIKYDFTDTYAKAIKGQPRVPGGGVA
jgi:hypothetical protein